MEDPDELPQGYRLFPIFESLIAESTIYLKPTTEERPYVNYPINLDEACSICRRGGHYADSCWDRRQINSFRKIPGESFDDAWKRFKRLQIEYNNHKLSLYDLVLAFFVGLDERLQDALEIKAGGDLFALSPNQIVQFYEDEATSERNPKEEVCESTLESVEEVPENLNVPTIEEVQDDATITQEPEVIDSSWSWSEEPEIFDSSFLWIEEPKVFDSSWLWIEEPEVFDSSWLWIEEPEIFDSNFLWIEEIAPVDTMDVITSVAKCFDHIPLAIHALDFHIPVPFHRDKFQGSFDPYFQIFSSHNSPDYIIIFVNTCATNFSFQEFFDILKRLRRGSKDGCQVARYDGTDVEDSFPFDNG